MITVHRPWGNFQQFTHNEESTVKVITINPEHRLSLQRHSVRDEHWFVLDGPVEVTLDDSCFTLNKGESLTVYAGQSHRIANNGPYFARILEISYGHFDEDDIERIEDEYGRA